MGSIVERDISGRDRALRICELPLWGGVRLEGVIWSVFPVLTGDIHGLT